jgi:hypothetical protein
MVAVMAGIALVLAVLCVFCGATSGQVDNVKRRVAKLDRESHADISDLYNSIRVEKARLDAALLRLSQDRTNITALQEADRAQRKQIEELMAIATSPATPDTRLTKLEAGLQALAMSFITIGEGIQAAESVPAPAAKNEVTEEDDTFNDEDDEEDEPMCEGCDCPKDDCQCTPEDDEDDDDEDEDEDDEDDDDEDEDEEYDEDEEEEEDEDDDSSDHDEDCDCEDCT